MWHVSSPLVLTPTTAPLPNFKDHLSKFFSNGTISVNENLVVFSNTCHNIGANENDICMRLFVNYLEGKVVVNFFELSPKIFMTWDELSCWFKSTYGQPQSAMDLLKDYNNLVYNKGETIKSFNLCFTNLYNQIP
jgi:hypothetical protein